MHVSLPPSRHWRLQYAAFAWCVLLGAAPAGCLSGSATHGATGIDDAPALDGPQTQLPNAEDGADAVGTGPNDRQAPQAPSSTFPALDANRVSGASADLLGFAGAEDVVASTPSQSLVVRARPFECLEVRGLANNLPYVQLGACADGAAQRFSFGDDGSVRLLTDAANANGSTNQGLCLAATGNTSVGVAACADDANQRWSGGGHLLQQTTSGLCLSRQAGTLAPSPLALAPCRRDDAAQSWAVGVPAAVQRQAATTNPNVPSVPNVAGKSATPLVGFARLDAAPPPSVPMVVALRQGVDHCFSVNPYATAPRPQVYRCEDAPQLVWQPDGHLETQGLMSRSVPGCLAAGVDPADGQLAVTFAACAGEANQRWGVAGHNVVHVATNTCLAYDETVWFERGVSLKPCDANEVRQAWAFGDWTALRLQAKAAQQGYTLAQLCAVQVQTTPPASGNANVAWVLNRFGGSMASFARAMQQAMATDCATIYQTAEAVEPLPPILLQFDDIDRDNVVATAKYPPYPVVTFASDYAWTGVTNPNFVSGTLYHEGAHVWDRRWTTSGVNYGYRCMVEGYADWVVYRVGNTYRSKSKGGAWNDGYGQSAHFLYWLDAKFPPTTVGQRFTERVKAAGRGSFADPNFISAWVSQQTGTDLGQLWKQYQASF